MNFPSKRFANITLDVEAESPSKPLLSDEVRLRGAPATTFNAETRFKFPPSNNSVYNLEVCLCLLFIYSFI